MKRTLSCLILGLLILGGSRAFGQCPVIPRPMSFSPDAGVLDPRALRGIVVSDASFGDAARYLQLQLLERRGLTLGASATAGNDPVVTIRKQSGIPEEGYRLEVAPRGVHILASDPHGAFNGAVTLLQLICLAPGDSVAACHIADQPAMSWRGLMLDESRHFFGKKTVEQLLDWMAFYKLDRLHWHLTDAPGWRIEIGRYPRLALVGGIGNYSDSLAPAAYYTRQDIAEIVAYARARFITIVPEIDMPGHAAAANRAYPEFDGGGSATNPDFTFNPGKEGTYAYLTGILREVNVLFPSGMIHIGGDEVSYGSGHWTSFPEVQQLMADKGFKTAKDVERYFVQRMADSVLAMGDRVMGWDEIAQADIPGHRAVIFWWRHEQPASLKTSLDKGYQVVLCPRIPFYLDFVQAARDLSGRRWSDGSFSSEQLIYAYSADRYPGVVTPENRHLILGLQGNLWTERVASTDRLQYLLFPRMAAVAEAAWTPLAARNDYPGFVQRVGLQDVLYQQAHLKYYDLTHPERTPEIIDEVIKK